MKSNKAIARTFGIFFLLGYVGYITGNILVGSIINTPDSLSYVYANRMQVISGVILMSVIATFFNVGLAVIMFTILKKYNKNMAYGYFSAAIMATLMLVVGSIFLLLLVPLSDEFLKTGSIYSTYFQTMNVLCKKGNFFSYQTGMVIWGLGGLIFCYLLYLSRIVPGLLAVWGFIGYIIFITGSMLAIFGYSVDIPLEIPGGLFEIFLSIWLIVRGFNSSAIVPGAEGADN
jgi:hypothetical protein